MTEQNTLSAKTRPRSGIVLWSLALNVFLICGIAAFLLTSAFEKPGASMTGGPARQFEMLAARLPAGDATVLRDEFAQRSEAIDAEHKAAHRTRDAVRLALRAEPYNADAARQAMADAEAAHGRLNRLLQDVIASAAGKMTPEGRAKLADFQPGPPRR
jgi:uncharacterized membrane protein